MNVRLLLVAGALVCGGCGSGAAAGVTASSPTLARAEQGRPVAPTGEKFAVKLDTMVSTPFSSAGQPFSVEVVTPLRATDGTILLPVGAHISGTVDRIDFGQSAPRLRLAFAPVTTTVGVASLAVSIVRAQALRVPPTTTTTLEPYEADVITRPAALVLPRGSQLVLELTQPLVSMPTPRSAPDAPGKPGD